MRPPRSQRGFTLLEVLVAIAILGLGLTMILSSQVGLFSSATRAQRLTIATNLARCKMSEVEVDLLKLGYPLTDTKYEGRCCGDDSDPDYDCAWKVERVKLPEGDNTDGGIDAALDPMAKLASITSKPASSGSSSSSPGLGGLAPLGSALPGLGGLGAPGALGGGSDMLSGLMGAATGPGGGLGGMLMSMAYPSLKPMLEASIRKVTVRVHWKEGKVDREFSVTQYVTDPQQGGLEADAGLLDAGITGLPGMPGATGLPGMTGQQGIPGLSGLTGLGR
ncbi:MAG TPA: prepilin-type N-terminal cleavage/methylation domain-containing protein [Polyangiaceae bacterium]|nr:prepilin-type N-terminal cleavage/methylation domain-containing protein [Polyangiaceae bacterium]